MIPTSPGNYIGTAFSLKVTDLMTFFGVNVQDKKGSFFIDRISACILHFNNSEYWIIQLSIEPLREVKNCDSFIFLDDYTKVEKVDFERFCTSAHWVKQPNKGKEDA